MIKITENRKKVQSKDIETNSLLDNSYYEMASFFDIINTSSINHGFVDINIKDLMNWLRNPPKFRRQLIQISKYYYNRDGIVTDCYDLFKTLPILKQTMLWDGMQSKLSFKKNKALVNNFLEGINPKKLATDTIFSIAEEGTCVWYNRDNKYIQFLENEEYMIDFMVDGKWQVFYDLMYIDYYKAGHALDYIQAKIEAAPDEVTMASYTNFKKDKEKYRYVPLDINKTKVFKLRGSRNEPYGTPYAIPAISSIMHRDLLEKTEKTLADRITNQLIIQKIGSMPSVDGKLEMPIPKPTIDEYHKNLKNLLQKKVDNTSTDNSTTATLTVPGFVDISELKINMTTFPKEVWERIDRDIYKKLGISESLNSGGGSGQSFGTSTINVEKIYSMISYLLDDIELAINDFISQIPTKDNFSAKLKFERSTFLDKETQFKNAEALFLKGRGSLKNYVEAAGYDFDNWLEQVKYENEVLKINELPVHATSFTHNGDNPPGAPVVKNPTKEDTSRAKGNGNTQT